MKSYIDYEYYQTSFPGIEIPKGEFDRVVMKASLFVKDVTFGRISEDVPEEVKDAVCAACEVFYKEEKTLEKTGGRSVKAENNDGHAITFADEGKAGQIYEAVFWEKMYAAVRPYLLPLGLLYRG